MAVLRLAVVLLAGCGTQGRAFPCCRSDDGLPRYPVVDASIDVTADQVELVRATLGAVPGTRPDRVARSMVQHAGSRRFWSDVRAVAAPWAEVSAMAEATGHARELAAIPYVLTGYATDTVAADCRAGPWQLEPTDPRITVADCKLVDGSMWSAGQPLELAGGCPIVSCRTDTRRDLAASTRAVLASGAWPELDVDPDVVAAVYLLGACLTGGGRLCSEVGPIP